MMEMCPLVAVPKKKSKSVSAFVFLPIPQRTASVGEFLGSFQHGISSKYWPEWCCLNEKEVRLGIELKWMSVYECLIQKLYLPDDIFITPRGCFTFPIHPNMNSSRRTGGVFSGGSQGRVTPGSISTSLKRVKQRTESEALAPEEALNEDRSLNCDYSNDSCMLPKKEATPWDFIHLETNWVLGGCVLTKLLPPIGFPMRWFCQTSRLKIFKLEVFNASFLDYQNMNSIVFNECLVLLKVKCITPKRFQRWSNKNLLLIHSWRITLGL